MAYNRKRTDSSLPPPPNISRPRPRPRPIPLSKTQEQIRFLSPYGSLEPFGSPLAPGRDSLGFNPPYASDQPFGSPNPPFDPLLDTSRSWPPQTEDWPQQFSSSITYGPSERDIESTAGPSHSSHTISFDQQTEPSFRQEVRKPPPYTPQQTGPSFRPEFPEPPPYSPQQTEPSVRPKERRPSISPPPYYSGIPTSDIVKRYRKEETGEPDFDEMRRTISGSLFFRSPENRSLGLANLSRAGSGKVRASGRSGTSKKEKYLESRGWEKKYEPETKTYRFHPIPDDDRPIVSRPPLLPSKNEPLENIWDPRFNKPIAEQDLKTVSTILPVGRQSFGPIRRRAMSSPNQSTTKDQDFPTDQQLFEERYSKFPEGHQNIYQKYRGDINWYNNPYAQKRMIKQSSMFVSDMDKKRMKQLSAERSHFQTKQIPDLPAANQLRASKRNYIRRRATLPTSIKDRDWQITPIKGEKKEEEEEEEEEPDEQNTRL